MMHKIQFFHIGQESEDLRIQESSLILDVGTGGPPVTLIFEPAQKNSVRGIY